MEINFDKSKTKKLKCVKIYDELYEQIQNGTYEPGSQLPSEATLASSMNVSRMTLRKALAFLREDGLLKDVPGVGHFVCTKAEQEAAASRIRTSASSHLSLPTHPIHDYCLDELETVELSFRIEPPSDPMLNSFGHYTAAVVIVDRYYKHDGHTTAYSNSLIPIELIGEFQIDLNDHEALLEFLEHTCYESGYHCDRCITYSTAQNFSSKNDDLSRYQSFLMTEETIHTVPGELLILNKHYIPAQFFELKISN